MARRVPHLGGLHALGVALLCCAACEQLGGAPAAPAPAGRVDAVMASPDKAKRAAAAFCDVRHGADDAPRFRWPRLDGPPPREAEGWQWVNLWATWCKPCIEEMPMLTRWGARLEAEGTPTRLRFLSVEADRGAVERFRKRHPGTPQSLVIHRDADLAAWMEQIGAGQAASVPVHLLIDPARRLRCVRSGSLREKDFTAVRELLR